MKFADEPGEGNGVMRSFFTTIADAFLENKKVPNMNAESSSSSSVKLVHSSYESVRRSGISGMGRLSRRSNQDRDKSASGLNVNAEPWDPSTGKDDTKFQIKGYFCTFLVENTVVEQGSESRRPHQSEWIFRKAAH